jgi:hypothetical protein
MADPDVLVTVSQVDERNGELRPIIASRDPGLIAALADYLARRLAGSPLSRAPAPSRALRSLPSGTDKEREP